MSNYQKNREKLEEAVANYDFIFVHGLSSVGKTFLMKQILEDNPCYLPVYINCNNVATPSKLNLAIVKTLSDHLGKRANELGKVPGKVLSLVDFECIFDRFCEIIQIGCYASLENIRKKQQQIQQVIIVLDQVELLRRTLMIDSLIQLQSIRMRSGSALSIIMISCESAQDFVNNFKYPCTGMRFREALKEVRINPWNKEEMIEMILMQVPKKFEDLYEKFVHNVILIVYDNTTKDLRELRSFCQEKFENFLSHCKEQIYERKKRNNLKLPRFEKFKFDEKELTSDKGVISIMISFINSFKLILDRKESKIWGQADTDRKVVINTSLLIVAAYVTANTQLQDDKRNFVKYQKRQKRQRADHCEKESKPFTLERLLQIHYSLYRLSNGISDHEKVTATDLLDSVLSDVQLLQDLDIVHIVNGDGLDSLTRYKLSNNISKNYVKNLAKLTGTPLTEIYGL